MSQRPLRIDSHQHFWDRSDDRFDHSWQEDPQLQVICRSFLPEDLKPLLDQSGIDYSVFVQTQHNIAENRWALELAEQHPFICGVVGWVDLAGDDCQAQLEEFSACPRFVGVRHVTQDEPDPDFITRNDVSRGLQLLEQFEIPFDLLFYARHLRHAPAVARKFPGLKLVIDHLSKPLINLGENDVWRSELQEAAGCENVYCKLSGMITEADWTNWTLNDIQPYVDHALECFGVERLMFGSDWPVCNLAGNYSQVVGVATGCLFGLSESEQASVFGGTAKEFYQLDI